MSISRLCLEGRKDQPWFSMDLPPSHNLSGDTTIAQISPVHQHRYHHLQHHYRNLDKAPRLSIRIDIWILLSDTDTICQLNQLHTNSGAAMLSTTTTIIIIIIIIIIILIITIIIMIIMATTTGCNLVWCRERAEKKEAERRAAAL